MQQRPNLVRINKYLALCGVGSRRSVEEIILEGRVRVNNKVTRSLSTTIDVDNDKVSLDDKKIAPILKHLYIAMHKPKGCITTVKDEKGRKTVLDYLDPKYKKKRIFPVGRLDYDTEGLLLLTTDGETANRITHPSSELQKAYHVRVEGEVLEKELDILRKGIEIDGTKTKPCKIKRLPALDEKFTRLEIIISEGRNRQVRRMIEHIEKNIDFLKRVAIGQVRLGGLSRGEARELTEREIEYLKKF